MVDWGDDGVLPNKIWGFVDLSELPENSGVSYGGLSDIGPGFYAIVESAEFDAHKSGSESELIVPITKEVGKVGRDPRTHKKVVTKLRYYLADVEAFVEPMVVVPDIGGKPNGYFHIKSRYLWRELFVKWLEEPHEEHEISDSEDNSDGVRDQYSGFLDDDSSDDESS